MGKSVYLSDNELEVLNAAVDKWYNWAFESLEEWEEAAYGKLIWKLSDV